jgi:two-component system sensor kinase FixL
MAENDVVIAQLLTENRHLRQTVKFLSAKPDTRPRRAGPLRRDIAEHRQAEGTLWESKQRMDLVLQGADLGTWDWNVQTGHVVFDERWARMLGYALAEIKPHVSIWEGMIHPDDLTPVMEVLNAHLAGKTDSYATEHRLRHKSGNWIWVLDKGRVIERDAEGRPLRACGTHLDITERKQAEAALTESREYFRRIFEEAPIGMSLTSRDLRFFKANPAFHRMLGYVPDELTGKTFLDVTHPEHCTADRDNIERLWQGRIPYYRTEKRYVAKDGSIRWGNVAVSLIQNREGKPLYALAMVEDITDRKRSQTLMETQRDLAVSLSAIDDLGLGLRLCLEAALRSSELDCGGIYLYGEASKSMELSCHAGVSDDFARQAARYDPDLVNVQFVMQDNPLYADYTQTGIPLTEVDLREGIRAIAVVPIVHGKRIIGCLNVASRILTEVAPYARTALETIASQISGTVVRLQAEHALHESEQRFRTLFDAAPDAMYLMDLEGTLVDGNKAAEQLVGVGKDELVGRNLFATGLLPPYQIPEATASLKENAEGKTSGPHEFTIRRRDGTCRTIEDRSYPIQLGNRPLVLGVARDITEQKRAEERVRQREAELFHLTRVNTLGELASGIAHELNQPLSAIANYGDACICWVRSKTPDVPRIVRNLQHIVSQSERAGEVIREMRALIKNKRSQFAAVDLNEIVRSVLPLIHGEMANAWVQLVLELGEPLPRACADAIQIEQVLLNLMRNAVDAMRFMKGRSRLLTIRTKVVDVDLVQVEVCDTGIGLPTEDSQRIFEPFFTTKEEGLGLGLSISRSIVQMHKGILTATRNPDHGSTFVVALPAQPFTSD